MSNTIKKLIIAFTLAGILMTPACSPIEDNQGSNNSEVEIITSPDNQVEQGSNNVDTTDDNNSQGEQRQETKAPIQVITTEKELDEYFDSITDEEIEELFKIIESIDISEDINLDTDPAFDDVIIP